MKSKWKEYLLNGGLILVGAGALYLIVETIQAKNTGFETKTLWDWMELLIIPLVLAIGAFYLNRSEQDTEREIAKDRQQEVALQAYLDKMSDLLVNENLQKTKKKNIRDVARTRTLTVIRGLDGKRKGLVIRFLQEAGLINKQRPIIKLRGADLREVELGWAKLRNVDLSFTDLRNADLVLADLSDSNLENATLSYADLSWTDFSNSDMNGANLWGSKMLFTKFAKAKLNDVSFVKTETWQIDLKGAHLQGSRFMQADLKDANFTGANLIDATFRGADLFGANFNQTDLAGVNFRYANMSRVNLQDAIISEEQLAQVRTLEGATLPDGTKHE